MGAMRERAREPIGVPPSFMFSIAPAFDDVKVVVVVVCVCVYVHVCVLCVCVCVCVCV